MQEEISSSDKDTDYEDDGMDTDSDQEDFEGGQQTISKGMAEVRTILVSECMCVSM